MRIIKGIPNLSSMTQPLGTLIVLNLSSSFRSIFFFFSARFGGDQLCCLPPEDAATRDRVDEGVEDVATPDRVLVCEDFAAMSPLALAQAFDGDLRNLESTS